jgi:hypothetical protein
VRHRDTMWHCHISATYKVQLIWPLNNGQRHSKGLNTLAFGCALWGSVSLSMRFLCNFQCRKLIPLLQTLKRTPKTHILNASVIDPRGYLLVFNNQLVYAIYAIIMQVRYISAFLALLHLKVCIHLIMTENTEKGSCGTCC